MAKSVPIAIIAHRGFWLEPSEKNSRTAMRRAFSAGYGVELDVRDADGELIIAHDAPSPGSERLLFRDVLADHRASGSTGFIAVNIKADGLSGLLDRDLDDCPGAREACFAFDMSVPELLRYLSTTVVSFTRHSEYEAIPALLDRAAGVWLDCFAQPWVLPATVIDMLSRGLRAAVVSSELHGRPHLAGWAALKHGLSTIDDGTVPVGAVMLCTDFPDEAARFFG